MTDFERFIAMVKPYHVEYGTTNYSVQKQRSGNIVCLHTDNDYSNVVMYFDNKGKFKGFVDFVRYPEDED